MTFTEWLREIWQTEPRPDLPMPIPARVDVGAAERNGWIVRGAEGWRVGDDVPKVFGWHK
jgi:hypothetical protein